MLAQLTWTPDNGDPETLTVDMPTHRITEFQELIGTPEWEASEAVAWIPYRLNDDQPFIKGLFRLARITAIEPEAAS